MEPIRVRIRNHDYLIKSEENEDQVYEIAGYVNDKLREIEENTEGLSEKKTAILAALNIANDYFQALKERDKILANIRDRTQTLILNIDSAMR
ncbi:MAG: cell division protein ZapA [Desulfobacteraceae bacterium]|jgi:cell division protein ZapA